jgi:hypothetical protein
MPCNPWELDQYYTSKCFNHWFNIKLDSQSRAQRRMAHQGIWWIHSRYLYLFPCQWISNKCLNLSNYPVGNWNLNYFIQLSWEDFRFLLSILDLARLLVFILEARSVSHCWIGGYLFFEFCLIDFTLVWILKFFVILHNISLGIHNYFLSSKGAPIGKFHI